jgi:magnesium transporter
MDVRWIDASGVVDSDVAQLPQLLQRQDGVVWVDVALCDGPVTELLAEVFGFHAIALRDCVERNHVSKVHAYPDHVFVVLHAPKVGERGHVHYVELDQFIGHNYLVTVHGPLNPAVEPAHAFLDTEEMLRRLQHGRLRPATAFDLSHALVSSLTRREADLVASLAQESGRLEQRVMLLSDRGEDPEDFLEELFQVWYELLAVRTISTHSAATYSRLARLVRVIPGEAVPLFTDTAEQFDLLTSLADGQREFLHGVIEFYQTRSSTHMTIAAEKAAAIGVQQNDDMRKISAWVAIIAVPTGVTGFFGQNVPYPGFSDRAGFIASSLIIVVMALTLYLVFKHKRWL